LREDLVKMAPVAIICADWSKAARKRSVYVADVDRRTIERMENSSWTVAEVINAAKRLASAGPVIVGFDVPLGVPSAYLQAARDHEALSGVHSFLDLLLALGNVPRYWDVCVAADEWTVDRPFFHVPGGAGELRRFWARISACRASALRRIDELTRAKSVFIKSGIPGTVGSAACAMWEELVPELRRTDREFKLWPFEGNLGDLLHQTDVVIGEIYPRAAYAAALPDIASNRPLSIAKTDSVVRRHAMLALTEASWVHAHNVEISDHNSAQESEDDFDACITCAALLRCVLDRLPLHSGDVDPIAEGGMLGTGAVDLRLQEQPFKPSRAKRKENEPCAPRNSRLRNSSKTRVTPVFDQLARKPGDWVRTLLSLPSYGCNREVPKTLNLTLGRGYWGTDERGLMPPVALLSWLIRNLAPCDETVFVSSERRRLMSRDPQTIERALTLLRTSGTRKGWHILEGPTYPDALLETPDALVVIEGKRTEPSPTTSTTWMLGRHQMWRHLDAAWEVRGPRSVFGFFLVEGSPNDPLNPPPVWRAAAADTLIDETMEKSLPHRGAHERQALRETFLGVATWQAVCAKFHICFEDLPDLTGDS
jgi:hypothetical protein